MPNTSYPHYKGLAVGVPHTGRGLVPQWTYSVMNIHPPMNYNTNWIVTYGQNVDTARNFFAEQALKHDVRYLFTIDEDVTPPPYALRKLIYLMECNPDVGVAGGVVFHKADPQMPMLFRGNGAGPYLDWKIGETFEISGIGMGCTVIRCEVFKQLEKPWFKTVDSIELTEDGINAGEMWTEDLYFCEKVRKAGWKLMGHGGVICEHWDLGSGKSYGPPPDFPGLRVIELPKKLKKAVDLGCGDEYIKIDGAKVLRVDAREECKPDYRCDLRSLPFATGEFDYVYSSHVLEHFSRDESIKALKEWVRILKPEGELRIIVPNIKWAAQRVLKGKDDPDTMNVLYGAQGHDLNFHRTGFTPETLAELLKAEGFKRIDVALDHYNIYTRSWRVPPKKVEHAVMGGKKPKGARGNRKSKA